MDKTCHVPVLLGAVLRYLDPTRGGTFVDATYGAGGYSRALLAAADCRVVGIDRDPDAVARGASLAARETRFTMVHGAFGGLDRLVGEPADGVVFDLGVSSPQLATAERGFSFRLDGPLDMRMDPVGSTAADLVNTIGERPLADLLRRYGEEPKARRVARAIVDRRSDRPFARTLDLADVVRQAVGRGAPGVDPATRVFQALRIAVNDELGELERGLDAALRCLRSGGRLVAVSFHSLEDRIVKRFLASAAAVGSGVSRHQPSLPAAASSRLEILTRRVVRPDAAEIAGNPRARSAKLRAARRTAE